jgi:prephenate dehydratase
MRNHLIAIQGSVASFHDIAAKKHFGEEVTTIECGSFKEVCDKIAHNKADYGIIAIENKIAGSILLNYQLIESYDLKIIGEIYLPIELQLLAKPGVKLSHITEIISHPMALGQSQSFLSLQEGVTITEYKDTATCAQLVSESANNKTAVIAGPAIASKYNLDVIVDQVGDVKQNYTRFYILSKGEDYVSDPNKASITLQTDNKPGALSTILQIIHSKGLNLTKIQSVPIPNNTNAYSFHLDVEFNDRIKFDETVKQLAEETLHLKVLGIYKTTPIANGIMNNVTKYLN